MENQIVETGVTFATVATPTLLERASGLLGKVVSHASNPVTMAVTGVAAVTVGVCLYKNKKRKTEHEIQMAQLKVGMENLTALMNNLTAKNPVVAEVVEAAGELVE